MKSINYEDAIKAVKGMTHRGEVYSFDNSKEIFNKYIKNNEDLEDSNKEITQNQWYVALNMMANDYQNVAKNEKIAAELAYEFLIDEDAPDLKLERYLNAMKDKNFKVTYKDRSYLVVAKDHKEAASKLTKLLK